MSTRPRTSFPRADTWRPGSNRSSSRKKCARVPVAAPLMKWKRRPVEIICDFQTSKSRKAATLALRRWHLQGLGELGVPGQQLEQLQLIRHSAELWYRCGFHLTHHVAAMDLHRGFGDAQFAGNLLV